MQQGTCGVYHKSARFQILCRIVQNLPLDGRQCLAVLCVFISNVGLLADDAQSRARHVAQYKIGPFCERLVVDARVSRLRLHTSHTVSLRHLLEQLHFMLVHVISANGALVLHQLRGEQGFATRCGAQVNQPTARRRCQGMYGKLARPVLHREKPLSKGSTAQCRTDLFEHQCIGQSGVRLCHITEHFAQLRSRCFEGIDARRRHGRCVVGREQLRRRVLAESLDKIGDQPRRVAVLNRQAVHRVCRLHRRQCLFLRTQLAQQCIDKSAGLRATHFFGLFDPFVDGG